MPRPWSCEENSTVTAAGAARGVSRAASTIARAGSCCPSARSISRSERARSSDGTSDRTTSMRSFGAMPRAAVGGEAAAAAGLADAGLAAPRAVRRPGLPAPPTSGESNTGENCEGG